MLICLGAPANAAAPASVEVRLELAEGSACATRDELIAKIARRSDRIRFVDSGAARLLRAEFERHGEGAILARLRVVQPNGRRATRELQAGSCEEAADALALVAAVTLDPLAKTDELPPEAPPPEAETVPERPLPVARADQTPSSTAGPAGAPVRPVDERQPEEDAVALGIGVSAAAIWGPAPGPLPGVGASFEIRARTPSVWSPAARASIVRLWRGGFETEHGTAAFALTELTLDLCPLSLPAGPLELRPCGSVHAGLLTASGSETHEAREHVRPWLTLGASALVSLRVTETLEFSTAFGAGHPLVRDRFQFEPNVFHEVPNIAFSAAIGASIRFP